jgi:hypothetical protein
MKEAARLAEALNARLLSAMSALDPHYRLKADIAPSPKSHRS